MSVLADKDTIFTFLKKILQTEDEETFQRLSSLSKERNPLAVIYKIILFTKRENEEEEEKEGGEEEKEEVKLILSKHTCLDYWLSACTCQNRCSLKKGF